ncbi:putative helicase subunit of Holliday junction resolvase [Mesoplasma florum L1]|uniref:Helicase subunit of Holliday junction resolvase n=1 Tax=Mesoplasma florum (strain ATCC 33453 / NBRC 100688 / NCTC 11704 / L1) TaxID=265311 RepID=Q6F161_MESFL|nr:replication-associated recombination protein A [Mesoplasma florum]AAT75762.1 putative helicase subunit of Holliday junction resolvase [Mesoplasma florum L1]ATI73364.1 replication-associated recombination protein A [Mesoplasma florum]AVN61077.1 replication-associated recombination protein A [Mesoplasma florum]AVN61764.1 replication-associated recombination protein A [Mesoplasma florum]AVN65138.1 replication-associated recombination protein A [Mesoplasma florum]
MNTPLAYLLRPKTTSEIIGQENLLKEDGLIKKMISNNFCRSLIFYGPSGVGKTSFAIALANDLNIEYDLFNASYDKKENLTKIIDKAINKERFILIIDEIHRLNRDKQDILLNFMESGNVYLFATTTENPFFTINPAIRSRATILELKRVSHDESFAFVNKLIKDKKVDINIKPESLKYLCELNSGDIRSLLNNIELFHNLYKGEEITIDLISSIISQGKNPSGATGDDFHDLKSALQKSVRGSDVDASLHYFSRLLSIGDYETLMRRMVIMAYEDIGLANPSLPPRVMQACDAFRQIGMPEGIIPLGLVIIEMALSQKSNSALMASGKAFEDVKNGMAYEVPSHLKDNHYKSAVKLNRGVNYLYPHVEEKGWVAQQYLPNEIKNIKYFKPKTNSAYERKLWSLYEEMKK